MAYLELLANLVLVKKTNGKYRICVDFSNLNQVYPKYYYPLSDINKLVDATASFECLSSLDAMSGYHQTPMDKANEEKASFITEDDTYYYRTMPLGLKNVGEIYQRLMNKIFKE